MKTTINAFFEACLKITTHYNWKEMQEFYDGVATGIATALLHMQKITGDEYIAFAEFAHNLNKKVYPF